MSSKRRIKKKIYIFTNGQIAEPEYFKALRDYLEAGNIIVRSMAGKSPDGLVEATIRQMKILQRKSKLRTGDGIWLVFDVDDFATQNPQKFEQAMERAEKFHLNLAYSNRCFELWFLLHFQKVQTEITPESYNQKLKKLFATETSFSYSKNDCNYDRLFDSLISLLPEAKKHAEAIYTKDISKNPSTVVHLLVQECEALN